MSRRGLTHTGCVCALRDTRRDSRLMAALPLLVTNMTAVEATFYTKSTQISVLVLSAIGTRDRPNSREVTSSLLRLINTESLQPFSYGTKYHVPKSSLTHL